MDSKSYIRGVLGPLGLQVFTLGPGKCVSLSYLQSCVPLSKAAPALHIPVAIVAQL